MMDNRLDNGTERKKLEFRYQSLLFAGVAFFVLAYSAGQYIIPFYILGNYIQNGLLIVLMIFFLMVIWGMYRDGFIAFQNISYAAVLGLVLAGLASCFVNGDIEITIYGDEFQGAGLIVLLSYYVLFIATSLIQVKNYRRYLFCCLIVVFTIICLFGILQFFDVPCVIRTLGSHVAIYPTRNQNAFAVFPVYLFGLSMGWILYGEEKQKAFLGFRYVVLGIAFASALCALSSLVYVAFLMQLLLAVFLEVLSKRRQFKKVLLILLECGMIFLIIELVSEGRIAGEFFSVFRQIRDADSILSDSLGSGRMAIWKATIRELPKYWLFGCGIEKHSVIMDFETMSINSDAHNGYLGIWMEQGVFAIVSYLLFLFSLFIPAILSFWKQHEYETDFVTKAAFLTFFGYIAQDFVNINVLQVVPYFWPVCGLLFLQKKQERDK